MRRVGLSLGIVVTLVCIWLPVVSVTAQRPLAAPTATLGAEDLYDPNQLQDIWIRINARDWAKLREHYMDNTYYPCEIEWNGLTVYNVGIRSRGRASRSEHKPALRIDFNRYHEEQQFLGLKSLLLDNLWQDPSMIRERLAMLVFQRMGLPAPRETHARVYIGSAREFAGVYGVVESIDKPFLRHQFDQDEGFLYQYQWLDAYHFEDRSDLDWYAKRFEPKTHESDSTFNLFAPIRTLVHAVNDARESDLEAALAPYLNLRKFITHLAVDNFLSQPDGFLGAVGMSNFFLYRFARSDSWQVIPWDQDLAFAAVEEPHPPTRFDENVLSKKIWAVPELRDAYLRTLVEIAASVGPPPATPDLMDPSTRQCPPLSGQPPCGWLEEEVFREYAQIREAALTDPLTPYSNETFEQEIEFLKRFARQRGSVVRRLVAEIAPELAALPQGTISNTFRSRNRQIRTPE